MRCYKHALREKCDKEWNFLNRFEGGDSEGIYWTLHSLSKFSHFAYVNICFSLPLRKHAGSLSALKALKPHTCSELSFFWQQCVCIWERGASAKIYRTGSYKFTSGGLFRGKICSQQCRFIQLTPLYLTLRCLQSRCCCGCWHRFRPKQAALEPETHASL